jgi:hypothetical protein
MRPYGRNIPEKSGETTATEMTGRFNRTTGDIDTGRNVQKPEKDKKRSG